MAAETLKQTVDRVKADVIGGALDLEAIGPENYEHMMKVRKAYASFYHVAEDAWILSIFRAERDCEIIAAHVRPETGWTAGANSADLSLVRDDGDQGSSRTIAFLNGTLQGLDAESDNEWTSATTGLPGVYAPALSTPLAGEAGFAKIPQSWYLTLQIDSNGAGAAMGHCMVEITYRYL
jgi:hypothetical protein